MPKPGSWVWWADKKVWYVGPYKEVTSGVLKEAVIRDEHELYVVLESQIDNPFVEIATRGDYI